MFMTPFLGTCSIKRGMLKHEKYNAGPEDHASPILRFPVRGCKDPLSRAYQVVLALKPDPAGERLD